MGEREDYNRVVLVIEWIFIIFWNKKKVKRFIGICIIFLIIISGGSNIKGK